MFLKCLLGETEELEVRLPIQSFPARVALQIDVKSSSWIVLWACCCPTIPCHLLNSPSQYTRWEHIFLQCPCPSAERALDIEASSIKNHVALKPVGVASNLYQRSDGWSTSVQDTLFAVQCCLGCDSEDRVAIYISHIGRFSLPIRLKVLYNTERVDPKIQR
jgi:hypothetical protein